MSFVNNFAHRRRSSLKKSLVAIITGGAGEGIGHGITEALVDSDWRVLVVDRDDARLGDLREKCEARGKTIEVMAADVTSRDAASYAVETALLKYGRIDGLVNNAGVGLCKPLVEVTDEEFERLVDVDFRAAFRFSRAVVPAMFSHGGSVVNISSVHAGKTIRGYGLYGSIKAALEGLTRAIAIDYGAFGIRANCIRPGLVMSPQNRDLIRSFNPDPDEWVKRYTATKQVIPSLVTSRQVGDLVEWLLSPKAATVTGQSVAIDGGSSVMLYERGAR